MEKTTHPQRIKLFAVIISQKLHYASFLIILMFGSLIISFGQNSNIWFFGNYAGVNLNTSPPSVFTSSLMNTPEGCASLCNPSCPCNPIVQLEYYSNGKKLWDGNHQLIMQDLNGSIHSTQSALIIKHPRAKDSLTYVFTTDAMGGSHGLQYTVLKNNIVESKNNPLLGNATERLTIALHCNHHDFWIITHAWNSNAFYAYKLTKYGLETTPIISYAGSVHSGNLANGAGYLKASQKSNFLAQAIMGTGKLEVFRFDNQNGTVYAPITMPNIPDAYGVEFSETEDYLYVSSASGRIYQYNLKYYDSNSIIMSKKIIVQTANLIGALQIANDNKIYVSVDNKYYLGAITKPDMDGLACNYYPNYIYLNGRKTEAGLPPKIPRVFYPKFNAQTTCVGDTSFFKILKTPNDIDSLFWDFGDSETTLDTSTNMKTWYIYPNPDSYKIVLYLYYCGSVDTLSNTIMIIDKPNVNLGPDTSFCSNKSISLSGGNGASFLWSNGDTTQNLTVTQAGIYWIKTSNKCGDSYDTCVIKTLWPTPYVSLPADTNICAGDSIFLFAGDSNYIYIWQSVDTTSFYTAKNAGTYFLTAINEYNCKASDDFNLSITYPPHADLGNDTSICAGFPFSLDAGYATNYFWNNGNTTQHNFIDASGLVIVEVDNKCGYASDSIYVTVEECDQKIYVPNAFTPNGDGENDLFFPKGFSIDWNTFEMFIYDRWGELIYLTNDVNNGWDGKHKDSNELCQLGVYAWLIIVKDIYGNDIKLTGTVTLLR